MNQSNQRVVNNKLGLLNLAEELSNIARACRVMSVSRDTFYRYRDAVEHGGVEALLDKTRRKPNSKNRVDEAAERAVCDWAIASPAHGQAHTSNVFLAVNDIEHTKTKATTRKPTASRQLLLRCSTSCIHALVRALPQDHPAGVLSGDLPQEDLYYTRRIANRSRCVDRVLQS